MKLLITGGNGFVGRRLVRDLLDHCNSVCVLDKQHKTPLGNAEEILGDVRDINAVRQAMRGCDAVFDLAAEHRDDVTPVSLYHEVNVGGAQNCVRAAEELGIKKIVFVSSVAVYPLNSYPSEETVPQPFNPYGQSKCNAEKVYREWASKDAARSLVIVRPSVIFGEENRGNVYNLMTQIANGHFLPVGSGKNCKSMAYVGNVTAFLVKCLDFGPQIHLFNYADKPDFTTNELVKKIYALLEKQHPINLRIPYAIGLAGGYTFDLLAKLTGRKLPISAIRVKKFCADTTVQAERVQQTGFTPPYSILEALERTISYDFLGKKEKTISIPREYHKAG